MDMAFTLDGAPLLLPIRALVVAGWTGRDGAAVQHHIRELAELGVAPPSRVPLYYRVSPALLTQEGAIDVLGPGSSGEVEPLLVQAGGRIYLGLASDHTDRDLEAHSVAASKQACAKPVAGDLWALEPISGHLDDIVLSCWIDEDGREVLYQQGPLGKIRPLAELCAGGGLADGTAMLCGTLAAIGGVRPAARYRMQIADPTNGKTISLSYGVRTLPIIA